METALTFTLPEDFDFRQYAEATAEALFAKYLENRIKFFNRRSSRPCY